MRPSNVYSSHSLFLSRNGWTKALSAKTSGISWRAPITNKDGMPVLKGKKLVCIGSFLELIYAEFRMQLSDTGRKLQVIKCLIKLNLRKALPDYL